MKGNEFCRVLEEGGIAKMDGCGNLYVKDVTEVFQKQVELCRKDGMTISLVCRKALSRAASLRIIKDII